MFENSVELDWETVLGIAVTFSIVAIVSALLDGGSVWEGMHKPDRVTYIKYVRKLHPFYKVGQVIKVLDVEKGLDGHKKSLRGSQALWGMWAVEDSNF